jgi:hypothetical protein
MGSSPRERYTTRPFAAGGLVFEVVTAHDDDRRLVEALFQDVPPPSPGGAPITVFSLVRTDPAATSWEIARPGEDDLQEPSLNVALNLLTENVGRGALDAEPEYLHLHAAAAVRDGRAVVIAAPANTGKTTAVATLVARGWEFMTDETVRLSTDTNALTGLRKPLSIKPGGDRLVPHLEQWMIPPGPDPYGYRFVAIGATGARMVDTASPHLLILLERAPGYSPFSRPETEALHPADAVVELMQNTFDAERFGSPAARLAALAAVSHCYRLTVASPADTADTIEELFALETPAALDVSVLPPSDSFSPGVVSVAIGDRVVVHDPGSGPIFALDAGGTRVWRKLAGWSEDPDLDVQGPVIKQFVAELRALGVVAA